MKHMSFGISIAMLVTLLAFAAFVFYARSPALSEKSFPKTDILSFDHPVKDSPSSHLKIVTYNIGYASGRKNNLGNVLTREEVDQNLKEILATLKKSDADIVLLQEVDFDAARSFRRNQLAFLAEGLAMPYAAYTVTWNKNYVAWPYGSVSRHFGRIVSGQAILSRFPILNQRTQTFAKPPSNAFWYNWFYLDRILQNVEIDFYGKKISVTNVHLEAFDPKSRTEQLDLLAQNVLRDPHAEKIVGGDFNTDALSYQKDSLDELLKVSRLVSESSGEVLPTFPSWKPYEAIDHIYFSEGFQSKGLSVGENILASDHLPVEMELILKSNPL